MGPQQAGKWWARWGGKSWRYTRLFLLLNECIAYGSGRAKDEKKDIVCLLVNEERSYGEAASDRDVPSCMHIPGISCIVPCCLGSRGLLALSGIGNKALNIQIPVIICDPAYPLVRAKVLGKGMPTLLALLTLPPKREKRVISYQPTKNDMTKIKTSHRRSRTVHRRGRTGQQVRENTFGAIHALHIADRRYIRRRRVKRGLSNRDPIF